MTDVQNADTKDHRRRRQGFTLIQKLTMLVAFPLVFAFVFIGSLTTLLHVARNDAQRVQQANKTQGASNQVLQNTYKFISTGFIYTLKKDQTVLNAFTQCKQDFEPMLEDLQESCATDTQARHSAEVTTVLVQRLIDQMDTMVQASKNSFEGYLQTASDVGTTNRLLMREGARITKIQGAIHPHITSQSDWQHIIDAVMYAGMALSVVISVGALRFVHLDMRQRIAEMMRNIDAIGKREPLKETVGGSDELANLDEFIHSTDDSLRQLETQRQEFFSMLTHDMRAPLTQIQFSVGLLAEDAYENMPEKRKELVRSVVPEIGRLNRLVDDLLTANKLDSEPLKLRMENIPAEELLSQINESMEMEAASRHRSITVDADDSIVVADRFQIERVLANLCANALKYTLRDTAVSMHCHSEGDMVRFEIIDNGPGIPLGLAEHLFDRYRQGNDNEARAGFGLGLYIAKSIITAHGGEIGFRNKSDGSSGCVFYFTLQNANRISS